MVKMTTAYDHGLQIGDLLRVNRKLLRVTAVEDGRIVRVERVGWWGRTKWWWKAKIEFVWTLIVEVFDIG